MRNTGTRGSGCIDALLEAFIDDPRPGFLCEHGTITLQNTALSALVESGVAASELLKRASECARGGRRFMHMQMATGCYLGRLCPGRNSATFVLLLERGGAAPFSLTQREEDVLAGVLRGWTNAVIASRLSISVETVKGHVRRVLRQTGFKNRTELLANAGFAGVSSTLAVTRPGRTKAKRISA